jgi:hypothetical protein
MTTTPKTSKPAKSGRGETVIQAVIMLAVASMAGAASFTHVHDWTMHNSPAGTGNWFGWANAMVSELIPLAAGLEARRRIRLFGSAGMYPIALIVGAVALSLTGQFAEATPSFSGRLIAAVPALGFLALVKLVLSSPSAPPAALAVKEPIQPTPIVDIPAPSTAIVPAVVLNPAPSHLLSSARFAATSHQQSTGSPITIGELAARINVDTPVAAELLRVLDDENSPRVNGHSLTAVTK